MKRPRDLWSDHGYLFFAVFGAATVCFGWLCASLLGIPTDVPLRDALELTELVIFLLLLGICAALAYIFALVVSRRIKAILRRLFET